MFLTAEERIAKKQLKKKLFITVSILLTGILSGLVTFLLNGNI